MVAAGALTLMFIQMVISIYFVLYELTQEMTPIELDVMTDDVNKLVLMIVQSRQRFHQAINASQLMHYGMQTDRAVDGLLKTFMTEDDTQRNRVDNVIKVDFSK